MEYKSPLSIYFVWSKSDDQYVKPITEYTTQLLSRDINKPFSRSMNLPVFYMTTLDKNGIPSDIESKSEKSIIFVFLSKHIVANQGYVDYLKVLIKKEYIVIPIAIDSFALNLNNIFNAKNFIRSYDFKDNFRVQYMFISISHEIYRWALNENFNQNLSGKEMALKLFLSHAKDGRNGIKVAKGLKNFIDNSSINSFFDATDIAPGYRFDAEIIESIKKSTLIEIDSDIYSSRYWCQKEILCAKNNNRPIIAVDVLEEYEDRKFPYAANVPCVHITLEESLSEVDMLRILVAALLETLRFFYTTLLFKAYKQAGLIEDDAIIISRPPELSDIEKLSLEAGDYIKYNNKLLIYPEPKIYDEELEIFRKLGVNIKTPLSIAIESLRNKNIGISISEISKDEMIHIGQDYKHLINLSQEIAKQLLARNSTLVYGGDLRKDGFTQYLFEEAQVVQAITKSEKKYIKNYISWPIYLNDSVDIVEWKASYINVADMIEVDPSNDIHDLISCREKFLLPANPSNNYVWSRCLTSMREIMTNDCDIRICAGGKMLGYKGRLPGVLEEIIIAIKLKRPIFLLGGFGGVTKKVCDLIESGKVPEELTLDWQIRNNKNYKELVEIYKSKGLSELVDYNNLLKSINIKSLSNGLDEDENLRLFSTPFADEAIHLILKGIKKLQN